MVGMTLEEIRQAMRLVALRNHVITEGAGAPDTSVGSFTVALASFAMKPGTSLTGSDAGAWGYNFDITNINDPANKVDQPTNVTTLPS